MKRLPPGLVAAAVATLTLAGCSDTNPCGELPSPTKEQLAAAAQKVQASPVEVEVEHENVDCFVDPSTGRWTEELEEGR